MPMRKPVPVSWTRTYLGSAKATHANKSGFGFVEVYMQAKTIKLETLYTRFIEICEKNLCRFSSDMHI